MKFKGLPHRLETIFHNKNLMVVNNSKATNIVSMINSVANYKNLFLIIGGRVKDNNFIRLSNFKNNIIKCYIIGESTNFIYDQIYKVLDS